MVVNSEVSVFDLIANWFDRRRAARLARREARLAAQRKAINAKRSATGRPQAKRPRKAHTAKQHRKRFGVAPALRIINGGKA